MKVAEKSKTWETEIKNWHKLDKNTANLILSQGDTLLKETVDTAKSISARADRLMSILLPVASGLIAYIFNNLKIWSEFLTLTAILSAVVLLTSLFVVYRNFEKYTIRVPGEYPKTLLTPAYIDNDFSNDEQFLNMIIAHCQNLQWRIEKNDEANQRRMKNSTISLRILFLLLLSPILAYFLSVAVHANCS